MKAPYGKIVRETPRDHIPIPSSHEFDGITRCAALRELLAKHEEPHEPEHTSPRLLDRLRKLLLH